ncbi:MAG: hypothetical protein WCP14_00065 [bacterium]
MNIYQNKLTDMLAPIRPTTNPVTVTSTPNPSPTISPDCCVLGLQNTVFNQLIISLFVVAFLATLSIIIIRTIKKK